MSELLTGLCPNCGIKLKYKQSDRTVMCYACDSTVEISALSGGEKNNINTTNAAPSSFASFAGFDNPESGVVFLENFFETYDWLTYQNTSRLEIPEIKDVIGNNKIKNGAIPETWYLDYMGLYVPVFKKFEALELLGEEIIEKFNPIDPTEIFTFFDSYKEIARVLLAEKDTILTSLNSSLRFAERFSLESGKLKDMKSGIATLEKAYAKIATKKRVTKDGETVYVVVDKIEDLPAYQTARDAYAASKKEEYLAKGIDAEDVYVNAVAAYEAGNESAALPAFESIRDYSDSALYIQKINQYFNFFNELFRFSGKHFIYKRENDALGQLNLNKLSKKKGKSENNDSQTDNDTVETGLSLYEVVNGVPSENPIVKGIKQVITCYGSKFFYFKNKGIFCYDISNGIETVVDKGKPEQYCDLQGEYFDVALAKHAPVFAVKKKYSEDVKTGCLGGKTETKTNDLNPYTIILVNMATCTSEVIVREMVDVKLRRSDIIFYTLAYKLDTKKFASGCLGKKVEDKPRTMLMMCNLETGEISKVLDEDCEIHEVVNDNIIYTLWKPNDLNEDLHVYNMLTGSDVLIEKNIYEFFDEIDGMLYYTIGNEEFRPLVRNSIDGTQREQIMLNVKRIVDVRGGWFYVQKGAGYNNAIVKIRVDGKESVLLCTGIKKVHDVFDGNYLYYTDWFNCLRVVRIDGKENRFIAEKVSTVFPAQDGLYYCRQELVDDKNEALSLYRMDKDGHNIRKITFNIDKVVDDELTNYIYFSRAENVRFRVYKPGKEDKAMFMFFKLTKYYSFKKATGTEEATEPELILTLGLPENKKKTGCLAKFTKDLVYEEAPIVHSYKNRGMSDEEIMAEENGNAPVANPNVPKWVSNLTKNAPKKVLGNKPLANIPPANIAYTVVGFVYFYIAMIISIVGMSSYSGTSPTASIIIGVLGLAGIFVGAKNVGAVRLKKKSAIIPYVLGIVFLLIGMIDYI